FAELFVKRELTAEKSRSAFEIRDVLLLIAISFVLFFWNLGDLPFQDRGEPREGLVVQAMYSTGNWILPIINGDYIPFKPPLFHWFGVLVALVVGRVDEFVARFPSALFGMLGVLMTYYVAGRLWSRRAGFLAAVVLATSFGWWDAATLTQVDMTLAFFISASLMLFYFLYQEDHARTARSLVLAFLLGLATLAKGPLGLALPSFIIFVFLLLRRDLAFLKKMPLIRGAAIFILVAGSWYALAFWQEGWSFLRRQILDETLRTGVGSYGRHQPVYYFVPVLLYHMLPWSFFFPALAVFLYQKRHRLAEEHILYPLVWLIAGFAFFSFALGKRGIYILPLYPAVALLFGAWWDAMEKKMADGAKLARWLGFLYAISGVLAIAAISIYLTGKFDSEGRLFKIGNAAPLFNSIMHSPFTVGSLVVLAGCLVLLLWFLLTKSCRGVFGCLTAIALTQAFVIKRTYDPAIASQRTMKPFTIRVTERIDVKSPLFFYRAFDYGTLFYANRHIPAYDRNLGETKRPYFLLMWEEDLERLSKNNQLRILDTSEGRGPTARHRLLLVEPQQDSPIIDPKGYKRPVGAEDE
ncbi:MAG TPA: glycosyltransferase family 39 protein, partial [Candidatus Binatia bacterium]